MEDLAEHIAEEFGEVRLDWKEAVRCGLHISNHIEQGAELKREYDFVCKECGKEFPLRQKLSIYCSHNCASRHATKAWRRRQRKPRPVSCKECSAPVVQNERARVRYFCSRKCAAKAAYRAFKERKKR